MGETIGLLGWIIMHLLESVKVHSGQPFNSMLLNWYQDGVPPGISAPSFQALLSTPSLMDSSAIFELLRRMERLPRLPYLFRTIHSL